MKIALVHDYLNQSGGAERVLETFMEMFPDAPVYTLLYDKARTLGRFEGRVRATSFLDRPLVRRRHRPFIPLMPLAARSMNLGNEYDVIISSSAGFGKGVSYADSFHLCYCHTPLRYAWESRTYFADSFSLPMRIAAEPALAYLRHWDRRAAQRPNVMIANSGFIAEKIRTYYGREARVIYPPVDCEFFRPRVVASERRYFLALGRMMRYKRFDLIVQTFNELDLPLLIVGIGPEFARLQEMNTSSKTVFFGMADERQLRDFYQGARALIFPQVEDFGLVAAEAIASGTPVIAYDKGGAKEIVNARNGIFFSEQTVSALKDAVRKFENAYFSPPIVADTAQRFSKQRFKDEIGAVLQKNAPFIGA
ncbi:MAG: glycosyltransferase [Candidatus Liptonbacteria bacterium]|nr:glycosyltransferase [Candidatus Liptonbacteria bacterium]